MAPFFADAPRRAYYPVQGVPFVRVVYVGNDGPRGSGLRGVTMPVAEARATYRAECDRYVTGLAEAWDYVLQRGVWAAVPVPLDDLDALLGGPTAALDDLLG